MEITQIRKRDGSVVDFKVAKIEAAVLKAFGETGEGSAQDAAKVATLVNEKILAMCDAAGSAEPGDHHYGKCVDGYPTVEEIQDLVEAALMELSFFETAKAYIIYRAERKRLRQRDIFRKRTNLKPYEYPELLEYVTAIRHSYWLHTEFNFTRDIDDFKTRVADHERDAIKKTMLAIAQIEVAVKSFWGNIYGRIPKPEIGAVGFTFAESEVRHMDAYAHLLDILGLNDEFKKLTDIPVIKKRVEYLEKVITFSKTGEMREYSQAILLFSLFIEHVSLFSQFLIMMSFNKHKNLFKGISNAVEATSKEEQIHGMFGIDLINIIRDEHPEWFDQSHRETVRMMCVEAYQAESAIIDWIFETGELEFLPKDQVKEFVKHRLNNSLQSIGMSAVFSVDEALLDKTEWFNDEVIATKHVDFFDKRSINYSKRQSSVTSDDLF
ncbi:ribonucleotide reductase [Candidatus Kaiserbacteria bacterium RIFCSPHIGHO2_01_FULL_46_22]|uniref:ribonucleoside-diphosphate reductase n=1 Tax=Candidatus Kaiserbacteria bacterium RIFCSPHIGHO2_01_FULL_46_22 TaxID=1798475 RepID=A0A1F6BX36_9BACT|nr:MAG: ribonucleotide reductase [Candidatus Kaiserbacteria bacterium RIFCSPHIGHO2_01_FULL_46_22]